MAVLDHPHPVDPERVAHARDRVLSAEDASRLSGLLSLLADPVRSASCRHSTTSKSCASVISPWLWA
jgi:hypothetical protein